MKGNHRARALGASLSRRAALASVPLAVALVAVTGIALVARLHTNVSQLDAQAKANARVTEGPGIVLSAADSLDIDNGFVLAALASVPANATFAIAGPPSDAAAARRGISSVTTFALAGYLQFALMPRREVEAPSADYVLCYACDRRALARPARWLYTPASGFWIGRFSKAGG